jgi:hypothetical protein
MSSDKWEVERFTRQGREFVVYHAYDDTGEVPWEMCDGHGPVSEWRRYSKGYSDYPKAPGELVLCQDGGHARFYDFEAAVKLARKDGWDTAPYKQGTPGERAHRAAMADYKYLADWCNNRWYYVGVIVEHGDKCESCWGIESFADEYLKETARGLADAIRHQLLAERKQAREVAHRLIQERAFL